MYFMEACQMETHFILIIRHANTLGTQLICDMLKRQIHDNFVITLIFLKKGMHSWIRINWWEINFPSI